MTEYRKFIARWLSDRHRPGGGGQTVTSSQQPSPAEKDLTRKLKIERAALTQIRTAPSPAEKDLTRKLKIERATLTQIRTAPSPMVAIPDLVQQRCIACDSSSDRIAVCRYPAYTSGFFAGLILAQCKQCGLGWVPVPKLDLDDYYVNHYAEEFQPERAYNGKFYDKANPVWTSERHKPRRRARRHAVDVARFGPFRRVIDIGAGAGIFLNTVEAEEKYAWELDAYSVRILQDELGVTLQRLEDKTEFYDLVLSSHMLEHFTYDTLPGILGDAFRALRPGGVFYIEVPVGAYDLHRFVVGKLPERPPMEPHTLFFSSYALNRLLVAAGFEIVESVICPWTRAHVPVGDHRAALKGAKRREKAQPLVVIARRLGDG